MKLTYGKKIINASLFLGMFFLAGTIWANEAVVEVKNPSKLAIEFLATHTSKSVDAPSALYTPSGGIANLVIKNPNTHYIISFYVPERGEHAVIDITFDENGDYVPDKSRVRSQVLEANLKYKGESMSIR